MSLSHRRIARTIALLAALGCGCAPVVIGSIGDWTPLKLLAASSAVVLAMGLAVLAFGSDRWWSTMAVAVNELRHVSLRDDTSRERAWGQGLIAVAILAAAANLGWRLSHPDDPWDGDDQGAYLSVAGEIADQGGPGQLIMQLSRGEFEEANRHPLYLGLLSMRPVESFGRSLSASFAIITFGIVVGLGWRLFGPLQSGIIAVLLAVNSAWGRFGSLIVCESLLMGLSVLVWWQCLRWFGTTAVETKESESKTSLKDYGPPLLSGALLGLCFLTKGTGVVLLGCVVVWVVVEGALKFFNSNFKTACQQAIPKILLLAMSFMLVASPLLVRNLRRFGQPFYNVNSYLLFADKYEEFEVLQDRGEPVNVVAREYLASHTFGDLIRREASGLAWEAYIIVRMLGPAPLDDARILFGFPIACLAIVGLLRAPRAHVTWFITWTALQWLIFAWYVPIAAGERFVLPILAPTLVYAADGLVAVWRWKKPPAFATGHATSSAP